MSTKSRRDFLGKIGLGTLGTLALPKWLHSAATNNNAMPVILSMKPMGFFWDTIDPFLFCAHHEDAFPAGNADMSPSTGVEGRHLGDDFIIKDGYRMYHGKRIPGFPGHPHRGFETVTIVRKGIVDHSDSLGASGRYGEGDVQWMTAGKGVQHAEMFPCVHSHKDNALELFQVWLNLPKVNKMVEPHFKMLWGSQIPKAIHKDDAQKETVVEIIAGSLMGKKAPAPPPDSWAAPLENEVNIWNIKMEAGATITLPAASKGINRMLYFYEGSGTTINGETVSAYHAVHVQADATISIHNGDAATSILVLQGKPIGEQVMQYGPFVMNTKEEIQQAFNDYHATQFGGWPWPTLDNVHDKNAPRFAKHANGDYEKGV